MKPTISKSRMAVMLLAAYSVISVATLVSCGGGSQQVKQVLPLTVAPASLPNGTSQIPYSQEIKASGGVAPFTWTVSTGVLPHNLSLSTSTTNTATISGTPDTEAQAVAFTITVTDPANQTSSQPYNVSILLAPDTLTLAPPSLSFTAQQIGVVSGALTETVTNTGAAPVVISSGALTGPDAADFSQSNTCSNLSSGANCAFNVTFIPSQLGPRSAAITITDNTVGSPHSISVNGRGVASGPNATVSASSIAFGSEPEGETSPAQSFTLNNYGTTALSIASITATANFAETDDCIPSLAAGATCTINVTFTPSSLGDVTGNVSITDNATGSPQTVALSGTGVAASCVPLGGSCSSSSQCCAAPVPQHSFCTNSGFCAWN